MLTWRQWNQQYKIDNPSNYGTRLERKEMYKQYVSNCTVCTTIPCDPHNHDITASAATISLEHLKQWHEDAPIEEYDGEETMYCDQNNKDFGRIYAAQRLQSIYSQKYEDLQKAHNYWGHKPKSLKELKKWLADGNYTIKDHGLKEDAEFEWSSWQDFFRWGPEFDEKAYNAAVEKLDKAQTAAADIIGISTDEQLRLNALKDFEAFKVQ
jgi:hypothetical protein